MKNIFSIVENNAKQVILKVNANDNLTIARNPFIDSTYDYITVTKDDCHILTIIKKDGTTFSFHWGLGGYTLICESLEELKRHVIAFIYSKNISLGKYV